MSPRVIDPRFLGDAISYLVEPAAQGLLGQQRSGFLAKHQEGCLEGVLCIMLVVQNSKTEAEHHRSVTADEYRVSQFITVHDETIQQFPIRQIRGIPYGGQPSDVP
jgi:hypothetical protein